MYFESERSKFSLGGGGALSLRAIDNRHAARRGVFRFCLSTSSTLDSFFLSDIPLRGPRAKERVRIYSARLPLEALHLAQPPSPPLRPRVGGRHLLLRRALLTLYTSICYAVALCATVEHEPGGCSLTPGYI